MTGRMCAIASALLLSVACGGGTGDVKGPTTAEMRQPPYGAGVKVGATYDYKLYTHCGIRWTRIDGALWEARHPVGDGDQAGWGNPYDAGEMTIVDDSTAHYEGGPDLVTFRRTTQQPTQPCS